MVHPDFDYLGLVPYLAHYYPPSQPYISVFSLGLVAERIWDKKQRRKRESRAALDNEARFKRLEDQVFIKHQPMSEPFLQTDERWRNIRLGDSPYFVGTPGVGYGCAVCSVANLIVAAGWDIDPGRLTEWLNANGGFTDKHYMESSPGANDGFDGLLYWRVSSKLFPAFHYGAQESGRLNAEIWRADAGKGNHFQLRFPDGRIMDSIGGSQSWYAAKDWRFYSKVSCEYSPALAATPDPVVVPPPSDDPYRELVPMDGSVLLRTPQKPDGSFYGLNVRKGAGPNFEIAVTVPYYKDTAKKTRSGLFVTGAIRGSDGLVWYRSQNGNYFCSDYTSKPLK